MTLYTAEDVAERLTTTTQHVKRLRQRGEIPFVRVGKLIRFEPEAIEATIARWSVDARPRVTE